VSQSTKEPEKDLRIIRFLALALWFSVLYPAVSGQKSDPTSTKKPAKNKAINK
jgi:hypothetical protein